MYSSEILIAPRPVRFSTLTHVTSPIARRLSSPVSSISDSVDQDRLSPLPAADRATRSPHPSPRPSSEALDEFLSILRPAIPSLFVPQPQSPTLRARVYNLPSLHDTLSFSGPLSDRLENIPRDGARSPLKYPSTRTPGPEDENAESLDMTAPLRSFHPQASPISRIHTRNPFQRHPSYDYPSTTSKFSPLSPRLCPLPPPTPSELDVY